jgi:hypothetical protein
VSKAYFEPSSGCKYPNVNEDLIKRFLSLLLTPLIPYEMFEGLMAKKDINPEFLKQKMKEL